MKKWCHFSGYLLYVSKIYTKWAIFDILMTIMLGINMITRKMTSFFPLPFELYLLVYSIFVFQRHFQNSVPWGLPFDIRFWSVKYTFDDDHDELLLWYGRPRKGVQAYFQLGTLSEILTTANLQHTTSRIWIGTEPEFRLCWMKLSSSDHHTTTLRCHAKDNTFQPVDTYILFLYKIF